MTLFSKHVKKCVKKGKINLKARIVHGRRYVSTR